MTLIPRLSEKSYASAQNNTYVFNVPMDAHKASIIAAVREQYDVTPSDVRVVIMKGKPIRVNRGRRQYPGTTTRVDRKKAYVTMPEGTDLGIFDELASAAGEEKS